MNLFLELASKPSFQVLAGLCLCYAPLAWAVFGLLDRGSEGKAGWKRYVWRTLMTCCSTAGLAVSVGWVCLVLMSVTNGIEWQVRSAGEAVLSTSRAQLLASARYDHPRSLARHAAKMYSQNGEDGIISEIFRRIGTTNREFVEFGASDGRENSTALLLKLGWGGLWIDGDTDAVGRARDTFSGEVASKRLRILDSFVTAENIEQLFQAGGVPEEFDLLSIDIDRNDYHVWEAIRRYRPRVAVVEYNAALPASVDWVVDYDPDAWWDRTAETGASLKALERLGRSKGYFLVGCEISGVNAFFVRSDLVEDRFQEPFTAENHFEPPRYWLLKSWGGHPR